MNIARFSTWQGLAVAAGAAGIYIMYRRLSIHESRSKQYYLIRLAPRWRAYYEEIDDAAAADTYYISTDNPSTRKVLRCSDQLHEVEIPL